MKSKYGENYQEHLLEQYKLYVEMADRISNRRGITNKFYISLLTGLLALFSLIVGFEGFENIQSIVFLLLGVIGLLLCSIWFINIRSYRQLNTVKFKVINKIEEELPFPCYAKEWEILGRGKDSKRYLQLTRVEKYVPVILSLPFIILLGYVAYTTLLN